MLEKHLQCASLSDMGFTSLLMRVTSGDAPLLEGKRRQASELTFTRICALIQDGESIFPGPGTDL